MKYLIVNGDDFGATPGINRGIIEAHQQGILTSASLMVDAPSAEEAVALSRSAPALSVGLHVDLEALGASLASGSTARAEVRRQIQSFRQLLGRLPTHLDSHHDVHRRSDLLPEFAGLAEQFDLPLRGCSESRSFTRFYGQWGGETHLEQVGVESLVRMLEEEIEEGATTEMTCHPGYVEAGDTSSYSIEREAELRTLCAPRLRQALRRLSIELISFHDLARFRADAAR